jgi:hypothetical protein
MKNPLKQSVLIILFILISQLAYAKPCIPDSYPKYFPSEGRVHIPCLVVRDASGKSVSYEAELELSIGPDGQLLLLLTEPAFIDVNDLN